MARFMSFLHSLDINMLQEFATFFEDCKCVQRQCFESEVFGARRSGSSNQQSALGNNFLTLGLTLCRLADG
jgi:hypothetical protein